MRYSVTCARMGTASTNQMREILEVVSYLAQKVKKFIEFSLNLRQCTGHLTLSMSSRSIDNLSLLNMIIHINIPKAKFSFERFVFMFIVKNMNTILFLPTWHCL